MTKYNMNLIPFRLIFAHIFLEIFRSFQSKLPLIYLQIINRQHVIYTQHTTHICMNVM